MIQLNLLPDIKREFIKAQKVRNKVISLSILLMIGTAGAIIVLLLYVNGAQRLQQTYYDNQINQKSKDLSSQKDLNRYLTIQNQLSALPALQSEKGNYSRLFSYLVRLNPAPPDNVSVSKLSLDVAGKSLSLEGFANNYRSLNIFQKTLENAELTYKENDQTVREKLFVSVQMTQVGVGDQQAGGATRKVASFTAILTYADKAFSSDLQSPVIEVPSLNITNSVSSAPKTFENNPEGN